jgi:hypothetical protein
MSARTYSEMPDEQLKRTRKIGKKSTNDQTSRFEQNGGELPHHGHDQLMSLVLLSLFAHHKTHT